VAGNELSMIGFHRNQPHRHAAAGCRRLIALRDFCCPSISG